MNTTKLGRSDLQISSIGLGCMPMAGSYGRRDPSEAVATVEAALDAGVNLLDTADLYGGGQGEEMLAPVLARRRDDAVVATKFGYVLDDNGMPTGEINGSPAYAQSAAEASLRRLGIETIDLYYLHRVDARIPIEDSVAAMADLVRQGKVRHIGLSEVTPSTIERAQTVHPIAAIQTEYSLFVRDVESGVLKASRDAGASFVAYSPLARGLLSGKFRTVDDLRAKAKMGRSIPFYAEEHAAQNFSLIAEINEIAASIGAPVSAVAVAWLLSRGEDVIPIVGASSREHLAENLQALDTKLSEEAKAALDTLAARVAGNRYDEANLAATSVETPRP